MCGKWSEYIPPRGKLTDPGTAENIIHPVGHSSCWLEQSDSQQHPGCAQWTWRNSTKVAKHLRWFLIEDWNFYWQVEWMGLRLIIIWTINLKNYLQRVMKFKINWLYTARGKVVGVPGSCFEVMAYFCFPSRILYIPSSLDRILHQVGWYLLFLWIPWHVSQPSMADLVWSNDSQIP
jgi:hypothetical protein